MTKTELDLNLDNYDLGDLLKLFHLNYDFDKDDLKQAKRIVLMTHPDKSGLDKSVFLFFTAAYKTVYKLYEFRHTMNQSTSYTVEKNKEYEKLIESVKHKENFHTWFNDMFESTQIKKEGNGYGSWLSSNEDIDTRKTTMANMNENFETKKKEVKALVVRRDFSEIGMGTSHGLYDLMGDDGIETFGSDIFSKLQYEDLKKAHTETVVPVTMEDYLNKKKYGSINELQMARAGEGQISMTREQALEMLNQKKQLEVKSDMERAFKLAKQEEDAQKANNSWWGKLKQLTL
jgi:hypothetical protein